MSSLRDLIPKIAGKRMRFYQGVSSEDLEGEMWLAAVELAGRVEALVAEGNEAALESLLSRAAGRAQKAEECDQRARRAAAAGYAPHDEVFYSAGALRRLLPAYLDGGVCEFPPQGREESISRPAGSATYGDWLATMIDLDIAMDRVSPSHRLILERYFVYPQGSSGWTHTEIANGLGIDPETLRKRVWRALRALQRELGGPSPYKGKQPGVMAVAAPAAP